MKSINQFLILSLFVSLVLFSCKKDKDVEEETPENMTGTFTTIMEKGFKTATITGVDLAVSPSGELYMAMNSLDDGLDSKASTEVWKYSGAGTSWTMYGGSRVEICDDESDAPGIAIDNTGKIYVSYEFYNDDTDVRYNANVVSFSTGSGWTCLGGNTAASIIKNGSVNLNGATEMAIKQDQTLMVATMDYGDGFVHYWDGSGWISYNGYTTDSDSFWGGAIELACFGNKPYVAITSGSGEGQLGVLYGSESNGASGPWDWLSGTFAFNSGVGVSPFNNVALALNSNGDMYTVAKYLNSPDWNAVVKKFSADGSAWEVIGDWVIDNQNQLDIVVSNDIVYVLITYSTGVKIYRLDSEGEWQYEGESDPITSGSDYYHFDAVAGLNGEIYVGYVITESGSDMGKIGAFMFTPYN